MSIHRMEDKIEETVEILKKFDLGKRSAVLGLQELAWTKSPHAGQRPQLPGCG